MFSGKRQSWRVVADCKSVVYWLNGFESHLPHFRHLAQLVEQSAVNRVVTGSSPVMSVMGVVNPMG